MAPTDRIKLPFRWEFQPEENPSDRSIRWRWRAYTQTGRLALASDESFDTLTQCMDDASANGYGQHA